MDKNVILRILMDVAMAMAVIFGWWYVALIIGVIGLFKFKYFVELVLAGFFYDALFGMGDGIGFMSAYAGTIVTLTLWAISSAVKNSIR